MGRQAGGGGLALALYRPLAASRCSIPSAAVSVGCALSTSSISQRSRAEYRLNSRSRSSDVSSGISGFGVFVSTVVMWRVASCRKKGVAHDVEWTWMSALVAALTCGAELTHEQSGASAVDRIRPQARRAQGREAGTKAVLQEARTDAGGARGYAR